MEFMKINTNMDTIVKSVKLAEWNTNIVTAFLNIQSLKMILTECICLCCNKNCQKKFDEKLK